MNDHGCRSSTCTDEERRHFLRYTRTGSWPMLQRFPVAADLHAELLAQMLGQHPGDVRVAARARCTTSPREAAAVCWPTPRTGRHRGTALPAGGPDRRGRRLDHRRPARLVRSAGRLDRAGRRARRDPGQSGRQRQHHRRRARALRPAGGRPADRVLLMLGTNDARAHGRPRGYRMVTPQETERNLRALVDLITRDLGRGVTVITPTAVDQDRIAAFFAGAPVRWEAAAVAEVAAVVRKVAPAAIDLHAPPEHAGAGRPPRTRRRAPQSRRSAIHPDPDRRAPARPKVKARLGFPEPGLRHAIFR